jgi:hypothetical protein
MITDTVRQILSYDNLLLALLIFSIIIGILIGIIFWERSIIRDLKKLSASTSILIREKATPDNSNNSYNKRHNATIKVND